MRINVADRIKLGNQPVSRMYLGSSLIWTAEPAVDFIFDGRLLDSRISFARPSTATLFDASGTLLSAAINAPRYAHDSVTLSFRGLLVEEQRTNRISNSEYFGRNNAIGLATQVGSGMRSDYKYGTDEKGFRVLDYSIYGTATSAGLTTEVLEQFSIQSGKAITLSARMSGNDYAQSGALNLSGFFDFWGHDNSGAAGWPWLQVSRVARPVQFLARTSTPNVNGTAFWYHRANFYANNSFKTGFNISARQVEDGAYSTSYIPTTGSIRTRAADAVTVNPQNWLSAEKGVFILQHDVPAGRPLLGNGNTALLTSLGPGKTALHYDASGAFVVHNGGLPQAVAFPAFSNTLQLLGAGVARANAAIARMMYYPRRLTVQQLQEATI